MSYAFLCAAVSILLLTACGAPVGIMTQVSPINTSLAAATTPTLLPTAQESNIASTGPTVELTPSAIHLSSGDAQSVRSLEELVATAPIVVIGRIRDAGEVINMARKPNDITQADPMVVVLGQVYHLEVQRYLKGTGPATLNVVQAEGFLYDQDRPVAIPTTQVEIDKVKAAENAGGDQFVPMQAGMNYLFFVHDLNGFAPTLNYVTTAAGQPWRFTLPDGGNARPESAVSEANRLYPELPSAALLGQMEKLIRDQGSRAIPPY